MNMDSGLSELGATDRTAVEHAADSLPRPVAYGVGRFLEAGRLADMFFSTESVLRFLCITVKSSYLTGDGATSPRMNDLLRKYTTRPAMGHWFQFLRSFAAQPELVSHYWPYAVDASVLPPLLNAAEPLLNARTRLHGHAGATITEEAERAAIRQFAPAWIKVLKSVAFLADSPLIVKEDRTGEWSAWMGRKPQRCEPPSAALGGSSPAALVGLPRGVLNLFPLTVSIFDGYRGLLEGLPDTAVLCFDGVDYSRRRIEYVGGVGGRGDGQRWFEDYRNLMQARLVPTTPLKLDEPQLVLEAQLGQALRTEVERLTDEQRWHGSVAQLDPAVCGLIDDALGSTAAMTVVCGDAGAGKTTHLLSAALRAGARGEAAMFIPASQLLEDRGALEKEHSLVFLLTAALEHRLHLLGSVDALVEFASRIASGGRVALFVDGFDELGGARSVKRYVEQLIDWVRHAKTRVPGLHVVWSIRGPYIEALEGLGLRLRALGEMLYRPTRPDLGGGDVVEEAIWIRPPPAAEIQRRYQTFRDSGHGLRPEIDFTALDARIQRACANPRWMVSFLRRFHGEGSLPASSPVELFRASIDDAVYALTGTSPHAVFPERIAMCEAFVRAERAAGVPGVSLDQMLSDPAVLHLVRQEREREVLLALQSAGLLRIEASEADPFSSPTVRASDDIIDVVLHLKERSIRTGRPQDWADLAAKYEDQPIGAIIEEAVAQRYVDDACQGTALPDLSLLRAGTSADVLLRLSGTDRAHDAPRWLLSCTPEVREPIARALMRHARSTGAFSNLLPLSVEMTKWASTYHGPETVELTARALRHAERVPLAESWLTSLADNVGELAPYARFLLAEVLRDKGQWRIAATHYGKVAAGPADLQLLATAARAECHVWLRESCEALDWLSRAEQLLSEDTAPEVRCALYIKRGIAERVRGKPVRSAKALVAAEHVADRHHLAVESAKIELEFGLVASLLLGHDEAERRVRSALHRHTAQRFVKGQKKGWYSLGYVLERAGRRDEAIAAYEESLRLNEHPDTFDLLGRGLCHGALARVLRPTDPERAETHKKKSDEAYARLQRKDTRHEPLL
jgi:tetratricopeptide (TPR) repeat protein